MNPLAAHAPLGRKPVLNALIDDSARGAARREHRRRLPIGGREAEPHFCCVQGRALVLDDAVAEHLHRVARFADIGQGRDGAQLIGALADVLVHARHGSPARLDERERLAGIDRGELLPVANENELVDAQRSRDLMELQHVVARHHRGLVDDEHLAAEDGPRLLIGVALPVRDVPLVGKNEGGDGLGLDPGALGEVRHHLVLEGEARDGPPLRLGDPRDRLQHGRLAGARNALHHHRPVLRRDDQSGGGELPGVELAIRMCLQALGSLVGRNHRGGSALPLLHRLEDALLGPEGLLRGYHAGPGVAHSRLARDQLATFHELSDPPLDMVDRDALQTEIESGLAELVDVEGSFTLGKHADGGRNSQLRTGFCRRMGHPSQAPIDERIVWLEDIAELVPGARQRLGYGAIAALESASRLALFGSCKRRLQQSLAIEAEGGRLLDPLASEAVAILHVQLGIARVGGDAVPPLGRRDAEFGRLL